MWVIWSSGTLKASYLFAGVFFLQNAKLWHLTCCKLINNDRKSQWRCPVSVSLGKQQAGVQFKAVRRIHRDTKSKCESLWRRARTYFHRELVSIKLSLLVLVSGGFRKKLKLLSGTAKYLFLPIKIIFLCFVFLNYFLSFLKTCPSKVQSQRL